MITYIYMYIYVTLRVTQFTQLQVVPKKLQPKPSSMFSLKAGAKQSIPRRASSPAHCINGDNNILPHGCA